MNPILSEIREDVEDDIIFSCVIPEDPDLCLIEFMGQEYITGAYLEQLVMDVTDYCSTFDITPTSYDFYQWFIMYADVYYSGADADVRYGLFLQKHEELVSRYFYSIVNDVNTRNELVYGVGGKKYV